MAQEGPKMAPKMRPDSYQQKRNLLVTVGRRVRAITLPQDGAQKTQDEPKMAPRWPRDGRTKLFLGVGKSGYPASPVGRPDLSGVPR